jgi:OmcA/MtrC family decaheme c-type cytochrome
MFYGCSGDDGAAGAAGSTGATGATGPPGSGVVAEETCVLCHSAGQTFDVNKMHRLSGTTGDRLSPGSVAVTVNAVTFGAPAGDNVPVTVDFTFVATDAAGNNITPSVDLRTATASGLSYVRFSLAKLVAGTNGDSDEWNAFVHRPGQSGSGPYYENRAAGLTGTPATGVYSYTFPDNSVRVSDGYVDNVVMRTIVEVRSVPITLFTSDPFYDTSLRRPAVDAFVDLVPPVGGGLGVAPTAAYPIKNSVSTAACNACHDPLGVHGGTRREYKYCQACHGAKLETAFDNTNLVNLVHKIHNHQIAGVQNIPGINDFSEVTYPQDIRNCTRCHQGPDADNTYANWRERPTITACTSCHYTVSFVSPAPAGTTLHTGGARANNSGCQGCHPPDIIAGYHLTENATPNNPLVPGTLSNFEYGINGVTVDNNNVATIKFFIKKDGAFVNLGDNVITRPTGFSGGPSFLFAYAMPQDGVAAPADYNNLGRAAGQPESLSIIGLPIVAFDNTFAEYTVTRANAFPVGAKMRAVALQGYFTQISGGTGIDNVGRHTFSVVKPVTGDAVRRVAVESGYTNNNNPVTGTPTGCLECHEIFEGHGGNRVSNAQVCVMCHNPNLSTSARTFTTTELTNPDIIALFGTDPLQFPEVANNFKELIHGIHGAAKRTTNFVDIRNFRGGALVLGDEVTFPGDLSHCGKCHLNNLYQNIQTTDRLLTTASTTTGADNTVADVVAARASVPNATDLVNTPAASACGHCHDSVTARSHFVTMGGEIRAPRGAAVLVPPQLEPVTP